MLAPIKDYGVKVLSKIARLSGEGYDVDGAARARAHANASLAVDRNLLKAAMPYKSRQNNLFLNAQSIGFGFELAPLSGASESLSKALADMLKNKLPNEVIAQFMLYKHGMVSPVIDEGFAPFMKKGGLYQKLAQKSVDYHKKAIHEGYANKAGVSASLCDYRVFVFFSVKKGDSRESMMTSLLSTIASELNVMGIDNRVMDEGLLGSLLNALVTPKKGCTEWPQIDEIIDNEVLIEQFLEKGAALSVFDDFIDMDVPGDKGLAAKTTAVNLKLHKYPEQFSLWQTPDLFSNLYEAKKNISCPFLITLAIHGKNQTKMRAKAKNMTYSLNKNNNGIQNFMNPFLKDELNNWSEVNEGLSRDEVALFPTCYNLVLFTDEIHHERHVAEAVESYRALNFEIRPAKCTQWLRFLSSLPFMPSEGLWRGLETLDETKTLTNVNVAGLLPIVSDFKGSQQGMMLPTFRNQLAFIDTFDDKNLSISNYNYTTCGTSGSGKSHLEQYRVVNALAKGEQVFIIDIGGSYKHLCQALGGVYVDASSIQLNPFTLFDFEGHIEIDGEQVDNCIQIRDLLAIMASPLMPLESIQMDYLLDAVLMSWEKNKAKASIDDVVDNLKAMFKNDHPDDRRLSDLITHLKKFTTGNLYGHMFNGDTPAFNTNSLVVFELGALEKNKELLKIVMFVMIVIIQGQFYFGPRERRKRCVIDEAWRHLTGGDNEITASFIMQGFRTARKHNAGFGVLTQLLDDLSATAEGRAIKACSSIHHTLLPGDLNDFLKDNPKAFNEQQQYLLRKFGEAGSQGFASLMVQYGQGYTFHRYFSDPFSRILFSTKGGEFEALERLVKSGMAIDEAVELVVEKLGVK